MALPAPPHRLQPLPWTLPSPQLVFGCSGLCLKWLSGYLRTCSSSSQASQTTVETLSHQALAIPNMTARSKPLFKPKAHWEAYQEVFVVRAAIYPSFP
ncbi:hypothetical protein GCK32_007290 [Trichostrongylus colubriformis]|uniref:Uncharacterized protein n=1 Tax=Trichostrongylus colubriformis TaxID=6319 RepID=A0AAN8IR54_TRICO